jgi:S-adenosyl-L-methionine hydrolase (adenosine-forming)
MATISLLTDFGTKDSTVGVMKGVVYNVHPAAKIVDLTHEIQNHSIEQAALLLASSYSYFAYGSIHLAVVGPPAGGPWRPILLESRGHYFIGPDNGLFALVDHPTSVVYNLDKNDFRLPCASTAFPERDIFAPAAGHLSRGVPADQLASRRQEPITKWGIAKPTENVIRPKSPAQVQLQEN